MFLSCYQEMLINYNPIPNFLSKLLLSWTTISFFLRADSFNDCFMTGSIRFSNSFFTWSGFTYKKLDKILIIDYFFRFQERSGFQYWLFLSLSGNANYWLFPFPVFNLVLIQVFKRYPFDERATSCSLAFSKCLFIPNTSPILTTGTTYSFFSYSYSIKTYK